MEISPIALARLLFYSVVFGFFIGVLYDACRIIRIFFGARYTEKRFDRLFSLKIPFIKKGICLQKQKKFNKISRNIVVFLGDFICVICAIAGIIMLNYAYNDGKFRFFTLVGLAIGFLVYFFFVGKLVMLISEPIAFLIKYLFVSFFVVFCYPIKNFLYFLIKNVRKMCFLCRFALEKRIKKEYNIREKIYLLEMAKNGFIKNVDFEDKE